MAVSTAKPRVLVTTVPFGDKDRRPLDLLESAGIEYVINPHKRKLTEPQLIELVRDYDAIIAGTEPITDAVMASASRLKLVSRVGVGLDSVDLLAARRRGIRVAYTAEAPAPAVAELTIALMLALLRSVHVSNAQMRRGTWHRFFGRRLARVTVGVIGTGRIGARVIRHLSGFGPPRILANDLAPDESLARACGVEWTTKDRIYEEADVITLHVPLTPATRNLVGRAELLRMKPDAVLVNTARGGIVNERDLYEVMKTGHLAGAGIDVFEHEPYDGELVEIERCILTAHMGSMSVDCRARMEIEATEEAVRFLTGQPLQSEVPQAEYDLLTQLA